MTIQKLKQLCEEHGVEVYDAPSDNAVVTIVARDESATQGQLRALKAIAYGRRDWKNTMWSNIYTKSKQEVSNYIAEYGRKASQYAVSTR